MHDKPWRTVALAGQVAASTAIGRFATPCEPSSNAGSAAAGGEGRIRQCNGEECRQSASSICFRPSRRPCAALLARCAQRGGLCQLAARSQSTRCSHRRRRNRTDVCGRHMDGERTASEAGRNKPGGRRGARLRAPPFQLLLERPSCGRLPLPRLPLRGNVRTKDVRGV